MKHTTMRRFGLAALLILLFAVLAFAERQVDSQTISTSGTSTMKISNTSGSMTASFEEIITGTPATVSIVIKGCKNGADTCEVLETNTTTTAAQIRNPTISKIYDYFVIIPSWTGGTNPTVKVNTTLTTARNGSGSGDNLGTAAASDVVALFSTCSGTQYLGADGACHAASATPGGSDTNLQYNNAGAFGGFADGTAHQILHGGRTFGAVSSLDVDSSVAPIASPTFTGTATVANLIDSGAGANLPVCTDGSKQFITAACGIALLASPTFTGTVTTPVLATSGSNGGINGTEGTGAGLTPATSVDLLYPDSTAHRWKMNNNNAGALNTVGITTAGTSGNIPKLAANGLDIVDSTIPSSNTAGPLTIPTFFPPFAISTSATGLVAAQNEMDCVRFIAPITKTFTKLTYRATASAGASSHVGFAIYSSDGTTRIATTGALDGTLNTAQSPAFNGTIIQNTAYSFCWTDDQATSTTWGVYSFNSPVAQATGLYNTSGNANFFHGANASVAGAPPTSLGALTANTLTNPASTPIGVLD